ncbi:hypothetical protein AH229_11030 [Salmonella enterica subsp. enterica serovar Salford]|uniref:Uncharacterized protein n=6 Tax=Salmonella enterica TaxID=28901 RepID=A0A751AM88_SALER|nr:hypothetical protein [Salmonella enterica]EBV7757494.1 hypothetical protein [Salmonella enterica subsp. enterica serovar Salford]HAF6695978.1 hypothetical protein [Salmonella enterica]
MNIRLLIKQSKSHADGFIVSIPLNYVIYITYFLKSPSRSVVCHEADEYSCVELGKILGICKN